MWHITTNLGELCTWRISCLSNNYELIFKEQHKYSNDSKQTNYHRVYKKYDLVISLPIVC